MAVIEIEVCDVCKIPGLEVGSYRVSAGTRTGDAVLCLEHAGPLEEILARSPSKTVTPRPRRSRTAKVVSLEEIEASKKARG